MLNACLRDSIPYFVVISTFSTNSFSLSVTLWCSVIERELDLELGDLGFSLGSSMFHYLSPSLNFLFL